MENNKDIIAEQAISDQMALKMTKIRLRYLFGIIKVLLGFSGVSIALYTWEIFENDWCLLGAAVSALMILSGIGIIEKSTRS